MSFEGFYQWLGQVCNCAFTIGKSIPMSDPCTMLLQNCIHLIIMPANRITHILWATSMLDVNHLKSEVSVCTTFKTENTSFL